MANLDRLDENRVETALTYLAGTDEEHALLSGDVKELEELLKSVKAKAFLEASGTVAERDATALSSEAYTLAVQDFANAWKNFKTLQNKREHEVRIVEIWRTLESSRRRGNM